jgi:Zn-dependent peptidase ImmA (M78 family)/transcriptional regulator with XRE-family HTH domain
MLSDRLRHLRLAKGFSLERLAAEIGGMVTKQSLSKYEKGKTNPSAVVLARLALALGVKAAHLMSEPETRIECVAYRKHTRLGKNDQATIECLTRESLETRIRLRNLTQEPSAGLVPIGAYEVKTLEDTESAADSLRRKWDLGTDPIASVTNALEERAIHVIEIDAKDHFDGMSAIAKDKTNRIVSSAVIVRRRVSGERQRLSLAHELGHLVLRVNEGVDEEKAAFRFAGAFLAPAKTLRQEVGDSRASIGHDELFMLKSTYGLSIQSLLFRLHDLHIISTDHYKQWWKLLNKLGWRKREPLEIQPERPTWLRRTVLRLLTEGLIAKTDAEQILGESLEIQQPISLVERRSLLKLPLDERRRILAGQAERVRKHYEEDTQWREIQGGDFIDY